MSRRKKSTVGFAGLAILCITAVFAPNAVIRSTQAKDKKQPPPAKQKATEQAKVHRPLTAAEKLASRYSEYTSDWDFTSIEDGNEDGPAALWGVGQINLSLGVEIWHGKVMYEGHDSAHREARVRVLVYSPGDPQRLKPPIKTWLSAGVKNDPGFYRERVPVVIPMPGVKGDCPIDVEIISVQDIKQFLRDKEVNQPRIFRGTTRTFTVL